MRMFNTRFYLAAPGTKPPFDGFDVYYDGPDATNFQDRLALPRAFVVNSVREVPESQTIDEMLGGDIDFRSEAIVPEGLHRRIRPTDRPERPARYRFRGIACV